VLALLDESLDQSMPENSITVKSILPTLIHNNFFANAISRIYNYLALLIYFLV